MNITIPTTNPNRTILSPNTNFTTINWYQDQKNERFRKSQLQNTRGYYHYLQLFLEYLTEPVLFFCISLASGWFGSWISVVEEWSSGMKIGFCKDDWTLSKESCCSFESMCDEWIEWKSIGLGLIMYTIIGLLLALTSALLVQNYAPLAAGSGIPIVKTYLGGVEMAQVFDFNTFVIKCLGLACSVGSGLMVGKEGPMVHVTCCIAYMMSRLIPKYNQNQANTRGLLSAACAAGVAIAFGAPIGGILFSLEEVSFYFLQKTMWNSFSLGLISFLSFSWFQFKQGFDTKKAMFESHHQYKWDRIELLWFFFLGVGGGIFGSIFTLLNIKIHEIRKKLDRKELFLYVGIITLITLVISWLVPLLHDSNRDLIKRMFQHCPSCSEYSVWEYLFSFMFKSVMITVTFGLPLPSGIFIPSMTVGALMGRLMGHLIQSWISTEPGMYAILGAAGCLAGVTRMTVSLVVIMFELTGALHYVLPIMFTVIVSKTVADIICSESIYDLLIQFKGYPYLRKNIKVKGVAQDIMTSMDRLICIYEHEHDYHHVLEYPYKGYPVITRENHLVGYIERKWLESKEIDDLLSEDIKLHMMPACSVHPLTKTKIVFELFSRMGLGNIFVVQNGVLKGMITKKDVIYVSSL